MKKEQKCVVVAAGILAVLVALSFCVVANVVSNENRLLRVKAFLGLVETSVVESIPPEPCVAE